MARNREAILAAKRRWYNEKYRTDPEFRERESKRKAEWFAENEERRAAMREYIQRLREDPAYLAMEAAQKREHRRRLKASGQLSRELEERIEKRRREMFG